ncbi:hypothetical protein IEO21_11078 [Rhodonia placenta]|uniref:Uncharacterized protein n=1 Tax=Rhodonia placenta TaxID=104341 RepID=A0A8H7TVJ4_9APHY|nr:hypothetical protein IEO21_11078 [Postia placenta]
MRPSEKEISLVNALAVGKEGTDTLIASGSTQAATNAPVASPSASTSATSVKSEQSELVDLMAQVKLMREELEHYQALKEESF